MLNSKTASGHLRFSAWNCTAVFNIRDLTSEFSPVQSVLTCMTANMKTIASTQKAFALWTLCNPMIVASVQLIIGCTVQTVTVHRDRGNKKQHSHGLTRVNWGVGFTPKSWPENKRRKQLWDSSIFSQICNVRGINTHRVLAERPNITLLLEDFLLLVTSHCWGLQYPNGFTCSEASADNTACVLLAKYGN